MFGAFAASLCLGAMSLADPKGLRRLERLRADIDRQEQKNRDAHQYVNDPPNDPNCVRFPIRPNYIYPSVPVAVTDRTIYVFRQAYQRPELWAAPLPTPKQLLKHGEKWRPYRSVAAWYFLKCSPARCAVSAASFS